MDQLQCLKPAIFVAMLLFPACVSSAAANAQTEAPPSIHCMPGRFIVFLARNASRLDANAKQTLDSVAQIATSGSCWNDARALLWITGHRDAGEDNAISLARAEAVRNYLAGKGLPVARIRVLDAADTRPRRSGKSGTAEPENSRIELMFQYVTEVPARDTRRR
jgi:OmpA-OmpF porin, OOP family